MVMVHTVGLPLHTYKQVVSDSNQLLIRALRFVSKQCVGHLGFVKFVLLVHSCCMVRSNCNLKQIGFEFLN